MTELICDRELHEECGVFGIYGVPNAASLTYYGLHALQHRGQEGAGIVSADEGIFHRVKGEGLVTEVFKENALQTLTGNISIGHVRYSTAGGGGIENVQPFCFTIIRVISRWRTMAISSTRRSCILISKTRVVCSNPRPTARCWRT
ncbi:MAG: hypothetical protein RR971_06510 [Alistipes sp.]